MKVHGQLHAPATLFLGNKQPLHIVWAQS